MTSLTSAEVASAAGAGQREAVALSVKVKEGGFAARALERQEAVHHMATHLSKLSHATIHMMVTIAINVNIDVPAPAAARLPSCSLCAFAPALQHDAFIIEYIDCGKRILWKKQGSTK